VTPRIAVLVALAGLAAACGASPVPDHVAQSHNVRPCAPVLVRVAVMDGYTHRPVRDAVVRVADSVAHADRKCFALHLLRCRRSVPVRITAKGYLPKLARPPFKRRTKVVVRVYRRSLQWTMYGAGPERTQAQRHIRLRPPFRIVWARGLGGLIEFPAVVSEGVAYVGNRRATIRALSMRNGAVAWRRRLHEKMASSLAVVGDKVVVQKMRGHVWVLRG
jgi:hypothetical protein